MAAGELELALQLCPKGWAYEDSPVLSLCNLALFLAPVTGCFFLTYIGPALVGQTSGIQPADWLRSMKRLPPDTEPSLCRSPDEKGIVDLQVCY